MKKYIILTLLVILALIQPTFADDTANPGPEMTHEEREAESKRVEEEIAKRRRYHEEVQRRQAMRRQGHNKPVIGNISTHFCVNKFAIFGLLAIWIGSFVYMLNACKAYSSSNSKSEPKKGQQPKKNTQ